MQENKSFQGSSFRSYIASNVLSRQTTRAPKALPKFLQRASNFRIFVYEVTESKLFGGAILFVTLVNTACLLIQTDESISLRGGKLFSRCNESILENCKKEVYQKP